MILNPFNWFCHYVGILLLVAACGGNAATPADEGTGTQAPVTGSGQIAKNSSSSSPIAISDDDTLIVVVNNLNDSVSIINVGVGDANTKVAEIPVGDEPRTVAIMPDKQRAYVTNQASATVSVIDLTTN